MANDIFESTDFSRVTLHKVDVGDLITFDPDEVGRRVRFITDAATNRHKVILTLEGDLPHTYGKTKRVWKFNETGRGRGRPRKLVRMVTEDNESDVESDTTEAVETEVQ